MSTSPSWFDQEKFSRLVKKVGPKPITEVLPSVLGSEGDLRPTESLASTARISLVSKPPSLLADHRALPALPRRTTPLPNIKSLFPSAPPIQPPPLPSAPPAEAPADGEHAPVKSTSHSHVEETDHEEGELSEIWHKMSLLNEELARTVLERDQALHDAANLREQARRANDPREEKKDAPAESSEEITKLTKERDEAVASTQGLRAQVLQAKDAASASAAEMTKLTKERDDAVAESQDLRADLLQGKDVVSGSAAEVTKLTKERDDVAAELAQAKEAAAKEKEAFAASQAQEITALTGERDQSRREYADLRRQYETLKADQSPKEDMLKFRKEWEQQLDELKQKIEDRDKEIAALKTAAGAVGSGDEKLKQELGSLREQLAKTKDEASVAQRGLALSQKALQQTRDTLREATEGTSLSRHNFDNLKNECAILAQQNTVLQAQVDSLSRDLGAAKAKITTRLQH